MIRTILAFFGYVKVPKEVVELAMLIENGYKIMLKVFESEKVNSIDAKKLHEASKTLTKFLRSGRLLT